MPALKQSISQAPEFVPTCDLNANDEISFCLLDSMNPPPVQNPRNQLLWMGLTLRNFKMMIHCIPNRCIDLTDQI